MANYKTVTADGVISGYGPGRIRGFVISNTHASEAGSITLYDNASAASGNVIALVAVNAGDCVTVWFDDGGVNFSNGIYADESATGTMSASIFWE